MANSSSSFSITSLLNQQSTKSEEGKLESTSNELIENKDLLKLVSSQFAYYQSIFQNYFLKSQNNNTANFMDAVIQQPSLIDSTMFPKRIGHPYINRNPAKRKKPRTSFNRNQLVELEKKFMKQKYLASSDRSILARSLKMTDGQVKTWFQNRRTKWRRQSAEEREVERQMANKLIQNLTKSTKDEKEEEELK